MIRTMADFEVRTPLNNFLSSSCNVSLAVLFLSIADISWAREAGRLIHEAHSIIKYDLAGGKLPSCDFGENAVFPLSTFPYNKVFLRFDNP
mmetsp:Transcript_5240/g.3007  ORF Transcript_5240/g.3007 Transcript_5240/m.3007 type:complete len:91 (-) Transcript_5240:504-776(-)